MSRRERRAAAAGRTVLLAYLKWEGLCRYAAWLGERVPGLRLPAGVLQRASEGLRQAREGSENTGLDPVPSTKRGLADD